MMHTELRRSNVKPLTFANPADRQLIWAFGSLNPSIAAFPHRIVENTFENLTEWCKVVGANAAPWRIEPAFESSGGPFKRETYIPEMLHLWDTGENQAQLPAMMNADIEFPLLIAAGTAPDVLQKMWDHPIGDYYSYIEHLAAWIESLEWAYVPLEYENHFAMLVAGKAQTVWITEVDRRFASRHRTVFGLSPVNDRFRWDGPVQA
jgi:hypothetical protein